MKNNKVFSITEASAKPCKIEFSDDDYTRLIAWHLYDKNLTINRLRYHDRTLYDTIINGADGMYCHTAGFFDATDPFLLTFDEAKADADMLVNTAMLEYYWSLGRDIAHMKAESKWGSGFFNQLSLDLRSEFPDATGFSVTNLKYMKRWYAFYYEKVESRQWPVDEISHLPRFGVLPHTTAPLCHHRVKGG